MRVQLVSRVEFVEQSARALYVLGAYWYEPRLANALQPLRNLLASVVSVARRVCRIVNTSGPQRHDDSDGGDENKDDTTNDDVVARRLLDEVEQMRDNDSRSVIEELHIGLGQIRRELTKNSRVANGLRRALRMAISMMPRIHSTLRVSGVNGVQVVTREEFESATRSSSNADAVELEVVLPGKIERLEEMLGTLDAVCNSPCVVKYAQNIDPSYAKLLEAAADALRTGQRFLELLRSSRNTSSDEVACRHWSQREQTQRLQSKLWHSTLNMLLSCYADNPSARPPS